MRRAEGRLGNIERQTCVIEDETPPVEPLVASARVQ
jgi:hypothetical protein